MFGCGTVNKVILTGYIAEEPKKTTLPDGKTKISFVVATQKEWVSNEGDFKLAVEWHKIVAYGAFADSIFNRALKRNLVYIEGRLKTTNGVTEVVLGGMNSAYQTLRKVKETKELIADHEAGEIENLNPEQREAILVDEIEALLHVDLNFDGGEK